MSFRIHKVVVTTLSVGTGLPFVVPGTPRTVGLDPGGQVAVWFETGPDTRCLLAHTGEEFDDSWRVIGTTQFGPLMVHLCVQTGDEA